jgi:glycosyltransferase involved in cell wall biosynthesis
VPCQHRRGLDLESGRDLVICELGEGFADAIWKPLKNPALYAEIARRGRATAESYFRWNVSVRAALDAYSLLLRESGSGNVQVGGGNHRLKA